jgi:hypothetical protein
MLELKGDVVVPRVLAGPKICGHYLTSIVQASAKPGPKAHVVSHVNYTFVRMGQEQMTTVPTIDLCL